MWGNSMLFHLAKSVEKTLKKDKYRTGKNISKKNLEKR